MIYTYVIMSLTTNSNSAILNMLIKPQYKRSSNAHNFRSRAVLSKQPANQLVHPVITDDIVVLFFICLSLSR